MRDQEHNSFARTASYYANHQFDAGWVHPLDVLGYDHNGSFARGRDENIDEYLKSASPLEGRPEICGFVF
jgi:hypothetical protein